MFGGNSVNGRRCAKASVGGLLSVFLPSESTLHQKELGKESVEPEGRWLFDILITFLYLWRANG